MSVLGPHGSIAKDSIASVFVSVLEEGHDTKYSTSTAQETMLSRPSNRRQSYQLEMYNHSNLQDPSTFADKQEMSVPVTFGLSGKVPKV